MSHSESADLTLTRRQLKKIALMAPASVALAAAFASSPDSFAAATPEATPAALPPTPECDDGDDDLTVAQTEGPYYTPDSPERTSLVEEGMEGERMFLTGYVYSTDCQPVAKALLDFWHCDANGVYDNAGYRLRGHLFTDVEGLFRLETIKPGIYPGRTRHIHLKVQAPNGPILTSQLYFPDYEEENARDGIFDERLLVEWIEPESEDELRTAFYNFVVETT